MIDVFPGCNTAPNIKHMSNFTAHDYLHQRHNIRSLQDLCRRQLSTMGFLKTCPASLGYKNNFVSSQCYLFIFMSIDGALLIIFLLSKLASWVIFLDYFLFDE